jgi:hypothetical protein
VGYAAGSDVPVASKVYSLPGTLTFAANDTTSPLEVAGLCRYSTAERTTKNHPIYLFSYWHGAGVDSTAAYGEKLSTNQRTAMQSYSAEWISGFSDGSITAVRAGPNGQLALGSIIEEYVTHRDFPYTSSV